jgi:phytoene dehydrogenase-like protein
MHPSVVIVGGGHNGLVAAAYLARAGLSVQVFERQPFVGGAATTQEWWPGFRFMPCAHMVHAIHPKIIRDLGLRERGVEFINRPDGYRFWGDGTYVGSSSVQSPRNRAQMWTAEERAANRRFGEFGRTLRQIFAPYRLRVPPSLEEVRAAVAGTPAAAVLDIALTTRLKSLHASWLPTQALRDLYAPTLAIDGGNPLALALAYGAINAPDEETGEAPPNGYVRGGLGAFSEALAAVARENGATIHTERAVAQFLVERGRVIGIRLEGRDEVRADVVLSNLDPKRTFLQLMPPGKLTAAFRQRVASLPTAVSCVKLLAVVAELPRWQDWDGDPDQPSRGAVALQESQAHLAAVWEDMEAQRPPRAPIINVAVPSTLDPSLTQPGYHTVSCFIYPAPAQLRGQTWEDARESLAQRLIDQITVHAPNFRQSIRHYHLRTPVDLEAEQGLTDGCITHVAHDGEHLFWNRPLPELAHYRAPLPGLYLCGAGQHPGGEVSGQPGHNVAQVVLGDLG